MKNKKIFIFPIIALSGLFIASCNSIGDNIQGSNSYVSVTFDANGGTIDGALSKTFTFRKGLSWEYVQKVVTGSTITKEGYEVITSSPWTFTKNGTDAPQTTYPFDTDKTLYAHYSAKDIKIKLNPNGGTFKDLSTGTKEITVKYDSTFGDIKSSYTPTAPDGKEFKYYTTSSGATVGDDYIFKTNNEELTANYLDSSYVSVTFDCNGGHIKDDTATTVSYSVVKGTKWSELTSKIPTVERTGYTQNTKNWTTTRDGDTTPTPTTEFKVNTILYAKWDADDINIKINPNGGTISGSTAIITKSVKYNSTFGDIKSTHTPTPPAGKEFTYYTNPSGKIVGDDYIFTTTDEEIKANYLEVGSSINVTFDATSDGTIYGSQTRTYTLPSGLKWNVLKDNIVATPNDEAKEFKHFSYDVSGTDTELKDDTVLSKDLDGKTFKANYEYIAASNFTTDSWATLLHNASSLDNLKTVYSKTTFIGESRTVKIDNVDYTVKVIGEDHDVITGSDPEKKAALTFQFEDLVDDGISYAYSYSSSSSYADSKLKSYLNNNLFNRLPATLQTGIKAVNKKAYDIADPAGVKTYSDKLFALSMSEMGYTKLPDGTTATKDEGTVYSPYSSTTLETVYQKKMKGASNSSSYLLRSPAFSGETGAVWGIDTDGKLGFTMSGHTYRQPESVNTGMGVLPAFAI